MSQEQIPSHLRVIELGSQQSNISLLPECGWAILDQLSHDSEQLDAFLAISCAKLIRLDGKIINLALATY